MCAYVPDIDTALCELRVAIVLVVLVVRIVIAVAVTVTVAVAIAITSGAPVRVMHRPRLRKPEPRPSRKAAALPHLHPPLPRVAKAHDRIACKADAEARLRGAQLDLEQVDEARRGAFVGRLERVAAHEHFGACLPRREFRRRRRRRVRRRRWRVRERGDGERGEDEEDRELHC